MSTERSATERDAIEVAQTGTGVEVRRCCRFPTGLRNWVYDVELADRRRIVVRIAAAANRDELAGGVFWNARLDEVGVPVPRLLAHDTAAPLPYMVLERLAGTDLINAWDGLREVQLDGIAVSVADAQRRASGLDRADGFGYAVGYATKLADEWEAVLARSIAGSRDRIADAGIVDTALVDRVEASLAGFAGRFGDVEPVAFLDDATTKNVIVDGGEVTGIVDTDQLCFGDPLWAVALTRMSLLAAGRPTRYTEQLAAGMGLHSPARLELYTAIFALDFLSEVGQSFNRDKPSPVSREFVDRLTRVLGESLAALLHRRA